MGWIYRDFLCLNAECQHEFEDLVKPEEENNQICPICGHAARWTISTPHIASYSLMDKDAQAKHLRKRSRDHTMKWLKKDPSHLGQKVHKVGKKA
jgi:hypothetical protein